MRRSASLLILPVVALVAACSSGGAVPASPSGSPFSSIGPEGSSSPAAAASASPSSSQSAAESTYWLRMYTSQAIPPLNRFPQLNEVVITGEGIDVVPGAVPAIFPGPLVQPLFGRQVSQAGRDQIMQWARDLGLLSGKTDFTGGNGMPGGVVGQLELTLEGNRIALTGIPTGAAAVANPVPGSPEAFAEFWRRVSSLSSEIPDELGPEAPYTPPAYSILVGPAPVPENGMTSQVMDWPLDTPLATFGGPVANGTARCGTVDGADADTLRPSLLQANQLTQWVQDPDTSATYGLTVRPLVPGEDRCVEIFGL